MGVEKEGQRGGVPIQVPPGCPTIDFPIFPTANAAPPYVLDAGSAHFTDGVTRGAPAGRTLGRLSAAT